MSIIQGTYELNPVMNIQIQSDFHFEFNKKYSIKGENGSGKSSFIRNILYKNISKSCKGKIQYQKMGQNKDKTGTEAEKSGGLLPEKSAAGN